ncbi:MAG TPA: ABC transporter ATP-binding protein [Chitinophagales bacterium]|nr:ABC transporter ATP-binding protein [Chitinophagales bacterium]
MVTASNLSKSYGELKVLNDVSLHVNAAEVVSIVGASGAGKTTLLHLLGTLDKPDSGDIVIGGKNVSDMSDKQLSAFRNKNIGFVFQFHHLLPEFTALENVTLPALIAGELPGKAKTQALELLDYFGLTDRVNHKPSAMSGGEQQRVAVARALINHPKVVFADEPSGNLDSENARELHKLFFKLRQEFYQTFVIVTHNEELANLADRKLVMRDGQIVNAEEIHPAR